MPSGRSRLAFDSVAAWIIAALTASSVGCFLALIWATAVGAGVHNGFSNPPWPAVIMYPYFALPAAFILLLAIIVRSYLSRNGSE